MHITKRLAHRNSITSVESLWDIFMTFCKLIDYELIWLKLKWPISFVGHFHSELLKEIKNDSCQGCTNFLQARGKPHNYTHQEGDMKPHNYTHQEGDMKQDPYWGPTRCQAPVYKIYWSWRPGALCSCNATLWDTWKGPFITLYKVDFTLVQHGWKLEQPGRRYRMSNYK